MDSRERVVSALNHKEPDRVPIDIGGTHVTTMHKIIYNELKKNLGIKTDLQEEILQFNMQSVVVDKKVLKRLAGDIVLINPNKPKSWELKIDPDDNSYFDEWGIKYRLPKNGLYFEVAQNPLKGITDQSLSEYNWPDPYEKSRFEGVKEKTKYFYENTDFALAVIKEPQTLGGILQDCTWLVGFEDWFCLLSSDQNLACKLMDKVLDFHIGYWDAMLNKVGKYAQVAIIADDLGSQDSLMISPGMYRKLIKPRHKKLIDFIKSKADIKVMLHSDGAIREIIPDIIETGVDILNPIQLTARGMNETRSLKDEFGEKIVFWGGGCDTQKILPLGKPSDVENEVKRRMEDLKSGGGFIFAQVHNIQPGVPICNILALYNSALRYGKYQ